MNRLAFIASLAFFAHATRTNDPEYGCFTWDNDTKSYDAGDYISSLTTLSDHVDTADTTFNFAIEIEFSATDSKLSCDQVFMSSWTLEWDINAQIDAWANYTMFNVTYEEWTDFNSVCGGDYADLDSTYYVSATDMSVGNSTCAFDVYFVYGDGINSTDTTVPATTQIVTVYTNKSVVPTVSALLLAAVTTMFF